MTDGEKSDVIFDIPTIFSSNKNTGYRNLILGLASALFSFYKRDGLILIDPMESDDTARSDLIVYFNDLTEEGKILWKNSFSKWSRARDRDGNFQNIAILEKELKKIRQE